MSVSKWRYTEECNGRPCPGDCDHCSFEPGDLISRADAIEAVIAQRHKAELSDYNFALGLAEDAIRHLPSAETHEIRTETHGVCLISKDDAVETVCRTRCGDKAKGCPAHSCLVIEEFDALPSAEAEWIPCSERLPDEDGSYLVTSSFGKVYTAHFYSECGRWQYNRRGLIEAWMPLPKPYR